MTINLLIHLLSKKKCSSGRSPFYEVQLSDQIFSRNTKSTSYYEPPYLDLAKSEFPMYEALTVQIKGYDYPQLESFQKYAHFMATYMDVPVEYCWAHPARHHEVRKFKHRSTIVESTYKILMYERNLKIVNVDSTVLPLYIEVLQTALPEGSKLNVFTFDPEHEKDRYVPDHDLIAKMKELDELGGPPPPLMLRNHSRFVMDQL